MASRLTWQNVAAPDMSDALRGITASGDLFGQAASKISDALGGINDRQKSRASEAAMSAALQIRDVDQLDQALASGGLQSFGIKPGQATDDFMKFITGYRDDLAGNRADDLANKRNITASQMDVVDLDRNRVGLQQDGLDLQRTGQILEQGDFNLEKDRYGFGRTQLENERADTAYDQGLAEEAARQQADAMAGNLARQFSSPEQARRAVTEMNLDPASEDLLLAELDKQPDTLWQVSPDVAGIGDTMPEFREVRTTLEAREREANVAYSNNPALQLYSEGTGNAEGYASPVDGVIDRIRSRAGVNGEDIEAYSGFMDSAGEITGVYDALTKEYPTVPSEMIAQVIENSITNTGIGPFLDNGLKADWGKMRNQLDQVSTPEQMRLLETERAAMETSAAERRRYSEEADRIQLDYEWAVDHGHEDKAKKALEKLQALRTQMMGERRAPTAELSFSGDVGNSGRGFSAADLSFGMSTGPALPGVPAVTTEGLPEVDFSDRAVRERDRRGRVMTPSSY